MTQTRQITDPDNRFGITAFPTLAQASLINETPLRLKLRSVNLGVVDSLVPFASSGSNFAGASVPLVPLAIR